MSQKKVVGFGELLWDMLPTGRQMGGAPANFAYHATQSGQQGIVVSSIGHDEEGHALRLTLKDKDQETLLTEVDWPTGTVRVSLDEKGIPQYDICRNVAWDFIPFTSAMEALAKETEAICFGSLAQRSSQSRDTLYRFLGTMPQEATVLKVFDINLRQQFYSREIIIESLQRCNAIKLNDEEIITISSLLGYPDSKMHENCLRLIDDYDLQMVILTCGEHGSYIFSAEERSFIGTPHVNVADTVGAGDSFTAALCSALLDGQSIPVAHRLAVDVAAYVCTQQGASPPWTEEMKRLFQKRHN